MGTVSNPFGEVPVLPVVVPLALVVFIVLLWRLHARRLFSVPRASVAAAMAVYAAGIVGNTVFPIYLDAPQTGEPWIPAVALIPFADYEIDDAVTNLLVFVPLGVLIALLMARPTAVKVIAVAAGTSLGIELAQLAAQDFFSGGHIADINDFLSNVAGGAVGYGLFVLLSRIPPLGRFLERFRWRTGGGAPAAPRDTAGRATPAAGSAVSDRDAAPSI